MKSEKLSELRSKIDDVDDRLIELLKERMNISTSIADEKMKANISITDSNREQIVLKNAMQKADESVSASELSMFMNTLISLSKIKQNKILLPENTINMPYPTTKPIDKTSKIAFQGVKGAWGEKAAITFFPGTQYQNFDYFDDVFSAVKNGIVDFGVLPIENSQTGAIGEVYDLLKRNNCYIVGQVWITIEQCLLGMPDTQINDIREIFSHSEGFNQCRRFLKNKNWELTTVRNTAYAAQLVAEKNDKKYAAIGSPRAAELNGLKLLSRGITDNANNKTRFIAISSAPMYDETSTTTSISFSTEHKSGALCAVLDAFMIAGLNLSRIESRPVNAERYRFFVDLQANIMSEKTINALNLASMHCEYFEILGCYNTTIESDSI